MSLSIANRAHKRLPPLRVKKIFHKVFSRGTMELSVAFVGDRVMRALNKRYRGKDATTNVLTFLFAKNSCEVLVGVPQAAREAARRGISLQKRIHQLLIHGMLHGKGARHTRLKDAEKMESLEKTILKQL